MEHAPTYFRMDSNTFLEIRDLQILDIIYETRSVTKTAELLAQSQPTISNWLKRVRERVNDPLFVRTSNGMDPTPRCDEIVVIAREIMESLRRISSSPPPFDPATSNRVFRVCLPDAAQMTLLPKIVQYTQLNAPGILIDTLPVDENTARLLEEGAVDLAYGGFVPNMQGFHQEKLFEQDFICLANAYHPRIGLKLTLEDYVREAHVSVSYAGSNAIIDDVLRRNKVKLRILLSLQGFTGVARVIATTDLITTIPRQIGLTLAQTAPLKVLNCPLPMPSYEVKQYWHPRFNSDPGNQWLRGLFSAMAT